MEKDHTLYLDNEPRENVKYFAAHALMGMIPASTVVQQQQDGTLSVTGIAGEQLAPRCFDMAEAMMAEFVKRCEEAVNWREAQEVLRATQEAKAEAESKVGAANDAAAEGATLQ